METDTQKLVLRLKYKLMEILLEIDCDELRAMNKLKGVDRHIRIIAGSLIDFRQSELSIQGKKEIDNRKLDDGSVVERTSDTEFILLALQDKKVFSTLADVHGFIRICFGEDWVGRKYGRQRLIEEVKKKLSGMSTNERRSIRNQLSHSNRFFSDWSDVIRSKPNLNETI